MEVPDWTKTMLDRLKELEPENYIKILGFLLLNHTQQEMVEFAVAPDELILELINKGKDYIASPPNSVGLNTVQPNTERVIPVHHKPTAPTIPRPFSSPSSFGVSAIAPSPNHSREPQQITPHLDIPHSPFSDVTAEDLQFHNQPGFLSLEDQFNGLNPYSPEFSSNYLYQDASLVGGLSPRTGLDAAFAGGLSPRGSVMSPPSLLDYPFKSCHYFHQGFCRHGMNCRFSHGQVIPDGLPQMYGQEMNELVNQDHPFSPRSLENLEMEIRELLKARRGFPVSIASLPMLYQEKYGRPLQADGYLTESQRHGKIGFSLTKLLARLKTICLIDRPHGQHSVVLAEDAPRFMEFRNERSDIMQVSASSCQIYLTFPADSNFSEDDVLKYFSQFGPVRDVRIPRQEQRMFGFVSFVFSETVRLILSKGHPHFICGSRVLVKPYKEKSRLNDRKLSQIEPPIFYPAQYFENDQDFNTTLRFYDDNARYLTKHLIEEHESRQLLELQFTPRRVTQHPVFGHRMEELRLFEEKISCPPIVVKNSSPSDDKALQAVNYQNDRASEHIELPDSPFASPH